MIDGKLRKSQGVLGLFALGDLFRELAIGLGQRMGALIHHLFQLLAVFGQFPFGQFALGDIPGNPVKPDWLPVGVFAQ